jgi:hypothetical protein
MAHVEHDDVVGQGHRFDLVMRDINAPVSPR